jgi:hypothetical protein
VALQLVWRPLVIDAELLRQQPGTKVPGFLLCAEYERQLGGGSPLPSLMAAKG